MLNFHASLLPTVSFLFLLPSIILLFYRNTLYKHLLKLIYNSLDLSQIADPTYVSWFTGVPCLFHRFDLVVGGRRLLFSLPRIQLRILGSLSAGDS